MPSSESVTGNECCYAEGEQSENHFHHGWQLAAVGGPSA